MAAAAESTGRFPCGQSGRVWQGEPGPGCWGDGPVAHGLGVPWRPPVHPSSHIPSSSVHRPGRHTDGKQRPSGEKMRPASHSPSDSPLAWFKGMKKLWKIYKEIKDGIHKNQLKAKV